jgi:hypothetical protein
MAVFLERESSNQESTGEADTVNEYEIEWGI